MKTKTNTVHTVAALMAAAVHISYQAKIYAQLSHNYELRDPAGSQRWREKALALISHTQTLLTHARSI